MNYDNTAVSQAVDLVREIATDLDDLCLGWDQRNVRLPELISEAERVVHRMDELVIASDHVSGGVNEPDHVGPRRLAGIAHRWREIAVGINTKANQLEAGGEGALSAILLFRKQAQYELEALAGYDALDEKQEL
ncbi:MAG: hypothetical protein V3V20_05115 [Algisphaera sp.]